MLRQLTSPKRYHSRAFLNDFEHDSLIIVDEYPVLEKKKNN